MRRKPVTRSEIRFNGRYISALPVDAVRKEDLGRIVPILELWAPLLRSLGQWRAREDAQWAQFFNAIGPPRKPQTPEPVRLPDQCPDDRAAVRAARMWIRRVLADGPRPEAEVARRLAEMGLAHLLHPAADALGVRTRRGEWWLPG